MSLKIMPIIKLETIINAPIERVFDLSRLIDLHEKTMSEHNEKAIGGVTKGLINLGESVIWEATHIESRTIIKEVFDYTSPLWILGKIADIFYLGKIYDNSLYVVPILTMSESSISSKPIGRKANLAFSQKTSPRNFLVIEFRLNYYFRIIFSLVKDKA